MERSDGRKAYRNTGVGFVGAIVLNRKNEPEAIAVAGGAIVWQNEEEKKLTVMSHKDPEQHNPYIDQPFAERDDDGEVTEKGMRPLLEEIVDYEPRTSPESAAADGRPEGSFAPGEEVGDPAAAAGA